MGEPFTVRRFQEALRSCYSTPTLYCKSEFGVISGNEKVDNLFKASSCYSPAAFNILMENQGYWDETKSYRFLEVFERNNVPMIKFIEMTCSTPKMKTDLRLYFASHAPLAPTTPVADWNGLVERMQQFSNLHTDLSSWISAASHRVQGGGLIMRDSRSSVKIWLNIMRNDHPERLRILGQVLAYHSQETSAILQAIR